MKGSGGSSEDQILYKIVNSKHYVPLDLDCNQDSIGNIQNPFMSRKDLYMRLG